MGASLNTTCGMEICQSSMRPRERWGGTGGEGGGLPSITENGIRYEPLVREDRDQQPNHSLRSPVQSVMDWSGVCV